MNKRTETLMRILFCSLFIFASFLIHQEEGQAAPQKINKPNAEGLQVHFLGIPQGESTLVQFPNGYTILIDTGAMESAKELNGLLQEYQVSKIDTLILTGTMSGHLGGTDAVLQRYPVDHIMVATPLVQTIRNKTHIPTEKLQTVKEGKTLAFPFGVRLRILHPGESLSLSPEANSLAFQLVHYKVKILFTSDINEQAEEELVDKYNVKSQILKVSDSGSSQASSPSFIEQVDPHAAIIFSDQPSGISDEVMERLSETWIDIFQTKRHGTVTVISNGKDYQIKKENQNGYFKNMDNHS